MTTRAQRHRLNLTEWLSRLLRHPKPDTPPRLSAHLARDIGLDPRDHEPPQPEIRHPML